MTLFQGINILAGLCVIFHMTNYKNDRKVLVIFHNIVMLESDIHVSLNKPM